MLIKKILLLKLILILLAGCSAKSSKIDEFKSDGVNGLYRLSDAYWSGNGVQQNVEASLYYLKLAAERGDKGAQYTLGLRYDRVGDIDNSEYWYAKSLKKGTNGHSALRLSEIHYRNLSKNSSIEKATTYSLQAAKLGYIDAAHRLVQIYLKEGVFNDAYSWCSSLNKIGAVCIYEEKLKDKMNHSELKKAKKNSKKIVENYFHKHLLLQ